MFKIFLPKNENPNVVNIDARIRPFIFILRILIRKRLKKKMSIEFKNPAPIPPITRKSVIRAAGELIILISPSKTFSFK